MLYANSPVPLYRQLYYQLREAIEEGELEVGNQLPSERQLAAECGISRLTARRAVTMLRQEGYVRAYQGRGSFVAHSASRVCDHTTLRGFTEVMLRQGMTPSSKLMSSGVVPVSSEVARHLEVSEYDKVIRVRRLRLANDLPMALHTAYLRYPLCEPILEADLEKRSLYRVLQEDLGIRLAFANQTVQRVLGKTRELSVLNLKGPAAVMQLKRKTYDATGQVIEYLEAIHRTDGKDIQLLLEEHEV